MDRHEKKAKSSNKIKTLCAAFCILVIGIAVSFKLVTVFVPLGSSGVRTNQYAGRGVVEKDFGPGWHWDIGPIHKWMVFDTTVQTIELTDSQPSPGNYGGGMVQQKSSDGYQVGLDVTIKFRIKKGEVHKLFQVAGSREGYIAFVRTESDAIIRDQIGDMRTEDFYNTEVRTNTTMRAQERLAAILDSRHVELIDLLIRRIEFDPNYEKKIVDKKLADQDVELNKSKSLAAEKIGEANKIEAEAQAMVLVIEREKQGELIMMKAETEKQVAQIRAEAEKYALQNRADADLYAEEMLARGTLLVKAAEAKGRRLMAQALLGSGGKNYVALRAASQIQLQDMTVSTMSRDFLDVRGMADLLGATGE